MRGCLTSLLIFPAILLVVAWFVLPRIASPVVTAGLGVAGFSSSNQLVTVSADPPIELLTLHADRIHVSAANGSFHDVTMETVDITLDDVGLLDRTAGTVSGTLTGVEVHPADGLPLRVTSIVLTGSSASISASLTLSPTDLQALATNAVKSALGSTPSKVTFAAPDRATVVVAGISITGRIVITSAGGLAFKPTTLPLGLDGPIDLVKPGPAMPLRVTSVRVNAVGGMAIDGVVDLSLVGG